VDRSETIAAIATPPGRGAVAIVRLSGPDARAIGARVFSSAKPLRARVATLGAVRASDGAELDRALALWFPGPHSYTGEDVLELHVHGSPAVARETLLALLAAGARAAAPGEFTRRAYLAGKMDLSAAEAVADIVAAEHRGAVRAAAANLSGGLEAEVAPLRRELRTMLEELSAALDFPDEVPAPGAADLDARLQPVRAALGALAQTFERGRLVREGVSVAIVGPPNAGKSSLLNAMLGTDRALVSEIAGTTRDTIEETLALDDTFARIIDTAGLRAHADRLERAGIARAEAALREARIALIVLDASRALTFEAQTLLRRTRERPRVVFFNKADLGRAGFDGRDRAEGAALLGSVYDPAAVAAVRAELAREAGAGGVGHDMLRPHLATVRQADAVLEAMRAVDAALATLGARAPVDLCAGDLVAAAAALGEVSGSEAREAVLDGVFARFCVGK
jgi:tRNA modification GTPase